jgi:hypothetical protein
MLDIVLHPNEYRCQTRAEQWSGIERLKVNESADIPLGTRPPMHDWVEPHEQGCGMRADQTGPTQTLLGKSMTHSH